MKQLRAYPDSAVLAEMYPIPHQHHIFPDHIQRVTQTVDLAMPHVKRMLGEYGPTFKIGDLSTGDAAIPRGIANNFPAGDVLCYLGDMAPGYPLKGPLESTIGELSADVPDLDMFVCCETLEHVENPGLVLSLIRHMAPNSLLLTTPVDNWEDNNPEHMWAWDAAEVSWMIFNAGFEYQDYRELDCRHMGGYKWGMWLAI